jgi:mRNA interferase RelE/StbE
LAWKIEFSEGAKKSLSKLNKSVASRLLYFLEKRVAAADDPRSLGQALKGSELGEFSKYRVGDWRLICCIQDEMITVYVVKIASRREVYR